MLAPAFAGKKCDVTEENIQARIRAILLMAFANKFGYILLNTSNKSEAAVVTELFMAIWPEDFLLSGMFIKLMFTGLPGISTGTVKSFRKILSRKAPSAELKPDQLDTDSLPEYTILDSISVSVY